MSGVTGEVSAQRSVECRLLSSQEGRLFLVGTEQGRDLSAPMRWGSTVSERLTFIQMRR